MKRDTGIIFFIPSATIRDQFLPEFGMSPDKNCFGLTAVGISYPPFETNLYMLVMDDREIDEQASDCIQQFASGCKYLFAAFHADSKFKQDQKSILGSFTNNKNIAYKDFHRSDSDELYQSFKKIIDCLRTRQNDGVEVPLFQGIIECFGMDWELEAELEKLHANMAKRLGKALNTSDRNKLAIVWNENTFSEILKESFGPGTVFTSLPTLEKNLNKYSSVLILAELDWHNHKLTQFQGYQLAKDLIEKGHRFNLAFISFVNQNKIKSTTIEARLLAPIFPHYQLPLSEAEWSRLLIPMISDLKWKYIQRYVIEKGGIIDYLEHRIKYLNHNSPIDKIQEVLKQFELYHTMLPREIFEFVKVMNFAILEDPIRFTAYKNELEELITAYKSHLSPPDKLSKERSHYVVMIVEDNPDTLEALKTGLSHSFEVECYTSGKEALNKLHKNRYRYCALIVDIELLDKDGNWQPIQGFDIIEEASRMSHLVIYMLTALSKRAVSTIQSSLILTEVFYIPKDPEKGLPISYLPYGYFSNQLKLQIERKGLHRRGPKNGVFANGLLQYYYAVKSSENYDWQDIRQEIVKRVEKFLELENNDPEIIPRALFSQKPKKFTLRILETVLMHRLIILFCQAAQGKVFFSEIKDKIGFRQQQGKRYFNHFLGFSILESKDDEKYYLNIEDMDTLFVEEEEWLKLRVDFKNLFYTLNKILEEQYIPKEVQEEFADRIPKRTASLADCLSLLSFFQELIENPPTKVKNRYLDWIALDIDLYMKNYLEETEKLEEDQEIGSRIVNHLKTIRKLVKSF